MGAVTSLHRLADAPTSWRGQAACTDVDPELFFPIGTTGPAVQQIEEAKAVCAGCPVGDECLEFALATNQDHGIWGGATEEERARIKRRRRRAQA